MRTTLLPMLALVLAVAAAPTVRADDCQDEFIVHELVTCPVGHTAGDAVGDASAFAECLWEGPLTACPGTITPRPPYGPLPPIPPENPFEGCRINMLPECLEDFDPEDVLGPLPL